MLQRLKSEKFDMLVIGGGATGCGVAMDATTRGLKVAVIDRADFASGTSSRSTKLIHGGLRYLAQAFQSKLPPTSIVDVIRNLHFKPEYLKIVADDLAERGWMLRSAPFMATPLPMLVPLYRWWELALFAVVGFLYDGIAGKGRAVPPSRIISADEATFAFPALREVDSEGKRLQGALVIHDGQQDDARMAVHIMLTAAKAGAACANYVEVKSLLKTHEGAAGEPGSAAVCGAVVHDRQSGEEFEIRASQVVNACGSFSDAVRRMAQPDAAPIMVPSYGTHLMVPAYDSARGTGMVWFTTDGRVLYLLPWLGSTVAGTTDKPGEASFSPSPTQEETDFILYECNRLLREPLRPQSVRAAWSGIRPLVRNPDAPEGDTKSLSREHVVERLPSGLVTIAGGKWTTYRKMSQDAVDACISSNAALSHAKPCGTHELQLIGADLEGATCGPDYDRIAETLRDDFGFDRETARHLRRSYGTRALQIAELAAANRDAFLDAEGNHRKLHRGYAPIEAEVAFACRYELAQTAVDVLAQRTRLAFLDADAAEQALPRTLSIMAEEHGWDEQRVADEKMQALRFLETMRSPSSAPTAVPVEKLAEAANVG